MENVNENNVLNEQLEELETEEMQENRPMTYRQKQMQWFGHCAPDPLERKFSFSRMRKILDLIYNIELKKISVYKGYRYPTCPYVLYVLVDRASGKELTPPAPLHVICTAMLDDYDNPDIFKF